MPMVEVNRVSYSYWRTAALRGVELDIPAGAVYVLVGPNGAGKTTLLQVLMGLRRAQSGHASVLGRDCRRLTAADRQRVSFVGEGQEMPGWMRLNQVEAFLSPLYPSWDRGLANDLRDRFSLDSTRTLNRMSRGEKMKAALLCALAPRPELLVMDEPFAGMDALVRDDLVRGVLQAAGAEGWTVLISSHDIAEVEMFADWVGVIQRGRMRLSEPMDRLHQRYRHVEVQLAPDATNVPLQRNWLAVERNGRLLTFIAETDGGDDAQAALLAQLAGATQCEVRDATLREVFLALARASAASGTERMS